MRKLKQILVSEGFLYSTYESPGFLGFHDDSRILGFVCTVQTDKNPSEAKISEVLLIAHGTLPVAIPYPNEWSVRAL